MRIVAVIQARMGSSRLPGKSLADVAGEPLLAHVVRRTDTMPVDEVVVATSDLTQDDPIASLCSARGWRCHRGSEQDVLDRYRGAAEAASADAIVRVTADCPFVCPEEAGRVIGKLVASGADCVHNITVLGSGMPLGTGVEAVTRGTLETCWLDGHEPRHREHVVEYVYEHPERFSIERVDAPDALRRPDYDLSVDTADDLELVRYLYGRLDSVGPDVVPLSEVVALLESTRSA